MLPHPVVPDTAAETLALVAEDPAQWWRMHLLAASAAFLFALAAAPLVSLVRGRGRGFATAGAVLLVLGCLALTVAFSAEAHLWSLAADPSLDQDALVPLVALEETSPAMALLGAGFPLVGLGTVLLMTGLLRSGQVPWWQPALVLLGTVASLGAAPGSDLGPLLLSPAAVGYVLLARQVLLRTASGDRVGVHLGGLDGGPDLLPRDEVQLRDGGGGHVGEHRRAALDGDPDAGAVVLDTADPAGPGVARRPLRT